MPPPLRGLLLVIAAASFAGCLGGPQLAFDDVFAQSDATHDGAAYEVSLLGRVVNAGREEVRWVRVLAAVGADCLTDPREWPGFVDLGNLAPGAAAPVRATFQQGDPLFTQPALWWRLTHGDQSAPVAKGCGALPVG